MTTITPAHRTNLVVTQASRLTSQAVDALLQALGEARQGSNAHRSLRQAIVAVERIHRHLEVGEESARLANTERVDAIIAIREALCATSNGDVVHFAVRAAVAVENLYPVLSDLSTALYERDGYNEHRQF